MERGEAMVESAKRVISVVRTSTIGVGVVVGRRESTRREEVRM